MAYMILANDRQPAFALVVTAQPVGTARIPDRAGLPSLAKSCLVLPSLASACRW